MLSTRRNNARPSSVTRQFQALERQRKNLRRRQEKGIVSDVRRMGGPRPVAQIPKITRTFRFRANLSADLSVVIDDFELSNLILNFGAATTSPQQQISSFKIERVTVWGISDTSPGGARVLLRYYGMPFGSNDTQALLDQLVDEGGVTGNACVSAVPPKQALAHKWVGAQSTPGVSNLFRIEGRSGTELVVDVHMVYIPFFSSQSVTVTATSDAGRLFAALDNGETTPVLLADVRSSIRHDTQLT
jgi:hypothetical protein